MQSWPPGAWAVCAGRLVADTWDPSDRQCPCCASIRLCLINMLAKACQVTCKHMHMFRYKIHSAPQGKTCTTLHPAVPHTPLSHQPCDHCVCSPGAKRCVACPAGTIKAAPGNEGMSACVACPEGTEPSGSKKQCGECWADAAGVVPTGLSVLCVPWCYTLQHGDPTRLSIGVLHTTT